jgi:formate hydrogenlyase transcriptional activator
LSDLDVKDEGRGMKDDNGALLHPSSFIPHPSANPHPSAAPVTLADAEREHILAVLRDTDWVLGGPKGAASRLGMKRSTLHWKMKKLDISRPE